jgi:hypothetical protein
VAVGIGLAILLLGRFGIRLLSSAPPDPDPEAAIEVAVDYRCSICGMRITVTRAQGEDFEPPRHCHEDMEEAV